MTARSRQHPLYQEDLAHILATAGIERLRGTHILLTGATGLIGTQLVDALMRYNAQGAAIRITAAGRSRQRAAERLGEPLDSPLFTFVEQGADRPFAPGLAPDYIIPLASHTHPLAYSQQPVETMLLNLDGARHALELARRCHATVLYPSTVEIYGNARGADMFTEDYTGQLNLATSRACYTESKRACEALCQSYTAQYGVPVRIARLSRVFGPSVLPTDSKASSQFIWKALHGEDIVLKSEGTQFFSYTYVADAVSALLHVMLHGEDARAYNIASEACNVHLRDFAQACARAAGTRVVFDLPTETERRGFSVASTAILDNSRLKAIGWRPHYAFGEAVERTLEILKTDTPQP